MANELSVRVYVFDPALPFRLIASESPTIDTWHRRSLVTRRLLSKLSHLPESDHAFLSLSGGMMMDVATADIGIQIGSLRLTTVNVAIVDDGFHDILLGRDAVEQAFEVGRGRTETASPLKDDSRALQLQIHAVRPPIELREVERLFAAQRRLYNVLLVADGTVRVDAQTNLEEVIEDEREIPKDLRLSLQWIETGSILTTLRSASLKTLKYFTRFFETSATARLAAQTAEAQKLETESEISQATRDATIARMLEEQERLRQENIAATHAAWRREMTERMTFADDLISQVGNKKLAAELRREKDSAIAQLVRQNLLPVVKNIPHERADQLLLPPSSEE